MRKSYLIIAVILLSVGVCGGMLYYQWIKIMNLSAVSGSSLTEEINSGQPSLAMGEITNGEIFTSQACHFQFRYPQDWFITRITGDLQPKGTQEIVDSWYLTNFKPGRVAKFSPPPGSIKIDFEVSLNKDNLAISDLLPCGGEDLVECREIEINGVKYKKITTKPDSGSQSITVATIQGDKIYRVTGYLVPGEKAAKGIQEMEMVINTFRILK